MKLKTTLLGLFLVLSVGCGGTSEDPASTDSSIASRKRDGGKRGDGGTFDGGSSDGGTQNDGGTVGDGGTDSDGGTPACLGYGAALENACVQSGWGNGLTVQFGRLDGTLTAIATPGSSQCSQSNATHMILEVTMNGSPYAIALNVSDSRSSAGVFFGETDQALAGAPWSEGWHTDAAEKLDYANNLNVHSSSFSAHQESDLVNQIVCELSPGDAVSVYGLAWGPDGAHDVHRNTGGGGADGAIVLHANSPTPHYLMFHFANQTF